MGEIATGTLLFGKVVVEARLYHSESIEIYRARSLLSEEKPIALKLFRRTRAGAKSKELEFRREAYIGGLFRHTNLIHTNEFLENDSYLAFTMEFASRGSLADVLRIRDKLEFFEVVRLMSEVALGLQACHQRGIMHLDVKPENILLSGDSSAKVADFGIARTSVETQSHDAISGTLDYLSPEFVLNGRADARADLYALGVIGYLTITGKLPFSGHSAIDILCNKIQHQPIDPRYLRPECSEELSRIVMRCLRGAPEERYSSAQELGIDLIASQYPFEVREYIYGAEVTKAIAA